MEDRREEEFIMLVVVVGIGFSRCWNVGFIMVVGFVGVIFRFLGSLYDFGYFFLEEYKGIYLKLFIKWNIYLE